MRSSHAPRAGTTTDPSHEGARQSEGRFRYATISNRRSHRQVPERSSHLPAAVRSAGQRTSLEDQTVEATARDRACSALRRRFHVARASLHRRQNADFAISCGVPRKSYAALALAASSDSPAGAPRGSHGPAVPRPPWLSPTVRPRPRPPACGCRRGCSRGRSSLRGTRTRRWATRSAAWAARPTTGAPTCRDRSP